MKSESKKPLMIRYIIKICIPFLCRDFKKMEHISREYINKEKTVTELYHEILAYALNKQNDYDNCIKEYVLLLKHFSENHFYYYYLVKVLYRNKQYSEVLDNCHIYLSLKFNKYNQYTVKHIKKYMYWYAGYAAHNLKKYSQASKFLEEYIKYKRIKKDGRHFEIIGYGYLLKNELDKAKYYFKRAIKINPKSEYALNTLKHIESLENTE